MTRQPLMAGRPGHLGTGVLLLGLLFLGTLALVFRRVTMAFANLVGRAFSRDPLQFLRVRACGL